MKPTATATATPIPGLPTPLALLLSAVLALLSGAAPAALAEEPPMKMKEYQFVMLLRGEKQDFSEEESAKLQKQHLEHLQALWESRQATVVGPLEPAEGQELRGIVILDVGSVEEARRISERDPWVRAGGLRLEIHPWWAGDRIMQKGPAFMDLDSCSLALLRRPKDAPTYSDDELREIQAGHMANIGKMVETGDLILAGPMGSDGELRGLFVFRGTDEQKIAGLVAGDPAFQRGRLEMERITWYVPKGVVRDALRPVCMMPGSPGEASPGADPDRLEPGEVAR